MSGQPVRLSVRLDGVDSGVTELTTVHPQPGTTFVTRKEMPSGTYEVTARG